jgi:hypothetical protein
MKKRIIIGLLSILTIAILALVYVQPVDATTLKSSTMYIGRKCNKEVGEVITAIGGGTNAGYFYVHYKVDSDNDWTIKDVHLSVEEKFNDIPQTKKGNPKIGKFEYKMDSEYIVKSTDKEVLFRIPYVVEGDHDWEDGDHLYIAAHSVLQKTVTFNFCGKTKEITICTTSWADSGKSFPGRSWALYFETDIPEH